MVKVCPKLVSPAEASLSTSERWTPILVARCNPSLIATGSASSGDGAPEKHLDKQATTTQK
ncbi:hypothetical protein PanWU01x14_187810 [Parasponia andersonii]|uniref:Uncharacterized protein n=1 Tax=Parasponia andersonii TaxID=3476 RepID=A0A2P5C373_PARAD|nr:hypothetical protein PanWU01x14_187810 [Parasponia andersonii]